MLERIHADSKDPDGHFAMREYHVMQQQFALDAAHKGGSYKSLMTESHNLKRVFIGFMTMFGAQCTGTLVINSKCSRSFLWLVILSAKANLTRLRRYPVFEHWLQWPCRYCIDRWMGHRVNCWELHMRYFRGQTGKDPIPQ